MSFLPAIHNCYGQHAKHLAFRRVNTQIARVLVNETHLPLHHILVAADIPLPPLHLVVVADPDLLGHLVDEAEVMAHQHHTSIKAVYGISQGVDGLQVKMIGGLRVGKH
eukprot:1161159-Pelagomonas_calceolata.AAC.5